MARVGYVARRPLNLEGGVSLSPGDEVEGFDEWASEARHSHLSLGYVELVELPDKEQASKQTAIDRGPSKVKK